MILDSAAGHRKTFDTLAAFLASPAPLIEIGTAPGDVTSAQTGRRSVCSAW